jgi:hypothetical protein
MSAVLPTPALPTLLNLEDLKTFIQDTVKATVEPIIESVVRRVIAEQTPIENVVETVLATSELRVLKRISTVETVLGLNDFADEDEPTIPAQISILTEKIENITFPTPIITQEPKNIIPETKTEARAVFLVQYLENEVRERNGELFLNGSEIKELIINTIPEKNPDCQIKKGQNLRKLKKDVLEKAAKLFPGNIFINKNKNGRHETRVLFRPLPTVT